MRWKIVLGVGVGLLVATSGWAERPTDWYTTTTKTATTTAGATADQTLWDPAADFRIVLQGVIICTDSSGTAELEVSDVDVIPPVYFQSAGCEPFGFGANPIYVAAEDAVLTYTTSDGCGGKGCPPGKFSFFAIGYEAQF